MDNEITISLNFYEELVAANQALIELYNAMGYLIWDQIDLKTQEMVLEALGISK